VTVFSRRLERAAVVALLALVAACSKTADAPAASAAANPSTS